MIEDYSPKDRGFGFTGLVTGVVIYLVALSLMSALLPIKYGDSRQGNASSVDRITDAPRIYYSGVDPSDIDIVQF
jgi:hypothetical protein